MNLAMSSIIKIVDLTEQVLNFESIRAQSINAGHEGSKEEKMQLDEQCFSILKSFDSLITSIGDNTLSKYWTETLLPDIQHNGENKTGSIYNCTGYCGLLDRLSELINENVDKIKMPLPESLNTSEVNYRLPFNPN